jgi:methylenetetrahydrofolate reductase (NADPH)
MEFVVMPHLTCVGATRRDLEKTIDDMYGVGGYPETASAEADLANLKIKVDAGASFITIQLFFDNAFYFRFVERCREIGITVPIVTGLMPVLSLKQIVRFTNMCRATLPRELSMLLDKAGNDPGRVEEVGVNWAADPIRDLID